MAGRLQPINQSDFSGGANVVTSPYLLGPKQVLRAINMILDEHGSIRTRDGVKLISSAPSAEITRRVVKLYDFVKVDGTVIKMAINLGVAGDLFNHLYDRSTNPWTLIGATGNQYSIPDIVTFTNKAIIGMGDGNDILSYDGTTLTGLITNPPSARHISVHLGFLWGWGTAAASTSLNGPSSLRSSDVNLPGTWPVANQAFVSKDDGQTAQGLGLFTLAETGIAPTAVQVAFKDFSAYLISGVFGSGSFAIQKIKSDMGCVAPRTIQFCSGFGIIRLTHRGFALFNGVDDQLISEEVRPYLFGRDDITGLSWANIGVAYASQVQNPPLYICATPIDVNGLKRVFIYDLIRRAWTIATFNTTFSTLQLVADPNTLPIVLAGDFNTGGVRQLFNGDADDDGVAINWSVRVKPVFSGSPMERAYYRRMIAKFFDVVAAQTITAQISFGPSQAARSQVQVVPVSASLTTVAGYGLDTYGTSPYGSTPAVQSLTDVDLNFDLGVIAHNILVELSGSGKARLRGLEWHIRSKPITIPLGYH